MPKKEDRFKEYITEDKVLKRVNQIALDISKKYFGKTPIFIAVLNGSFIFAADLIRAININCEIDFIKISSYSGTRSKGEARLDKDISVDIKNRDVIVVEDIIDSGVTIKYLKEYLLKKHPKSVTIATLLMKPEIAKLDFKIDWVGFEISPEFVVGYGLDFNQKFRNLKGIYYLGENESD